MKETYGNCDEKDCVKYTTRTEVQKSKLPYSKGN